MVSHSDLHAFTGNKNIYLYAQDTFNDIGSGFKLLGTWTLPIPTPTPVSVTPNAGTAGSQIFQAVYSDTAGADKMEETFLMINNVVSWKQSCGARYIKSANQLYIINDAATTWLGPITPGSPATLQNSQCMLNGATSSAVAAGNNLTVNFSISFLPAFTGNKNIYLYAQDTFNDIGSGFKLLGTWTLP